MSVPLLDVNAQNRPLEAELKDVFAKVLATGRFILGEEVEAFERECAQYIGAKHAISISSGTDAILVALMALEIGAGDEVLCPSFTFFATAGCISRSGAVPVFCDVREDDFTIDLAAAAKLITPKTKAIMPVHLFGQCCDMDAIRAFADEHKLIVIEDAAQSIGATFKGVQCGNFGEVACFSFFPSKNLGGFGDGGLVTTNNDALAEKILKLRNHGMHPRYYHQMVGGNFRMDALQCALLRVKLRHLDSYAEGRARNAAWYAANLPLPEGCKAPAALENRGHVWNQFTLRIAGEGRRDAFKQHLAERGIGCEIYYPVPLHQQECFADLPASDCPVSEALSREVLSIPVYPELVQAQLDEVALAVAAFAS
ncbi:DegT/DnrJ/EryC1/StrS family aminotransferase [Luteolibacter ambystomatis]|uniref:DegT/DnrJ/EryC1/StrS family aminotransferase n=1 Tax=Luteolibacter ambystomatis TaxID=2824561 RepID=A0A975G792_9BACT|nr:DegT/DnrJ/EryC1/StrS family aminotransferase [Luteolibacter ambystomatis]QUE50253.1 DegT/DnrJ/EryC1/StrS family aminotransferase [Luteolibacter ambystomatis]